MRVQSADLRHAVRLLGRNPAFSATVVLILALGVAAATVIFGVADAILLRPLPYDESGRLVALCGTNPAVTGFCVVSPPDATDWAASSRAFEDIGLAREWSFLLRADGPAAGVRGGLATPSFFAVLRVSPSIGRLFLPREQRAGTNRVAVLSHGLWVERFGGDPAAIGRSVTLDGEPFEVVGVLPADFKAPNLEAVELWTPLPFDPGDEENRGWRGFSAVGRLAPGATLEQAEVEVAAAQARLARAHPESDEGWGVALQSLQDRIVGDARPTILVFAGAVALLLLIGCTNVANLLLVRATERRREFAVRSALGAGRGALLGQLLAESLVLAIPAAAVALLLARWGMAAFTHFAPAGIPRVDGVGLDVRVFGFALALSLLVAVVFGLAPMAYVLRADPAGALSEGGAAGRVTTRSRARRALVVSEMALTVMLLVPAALLARSFAGLLDWRPGFDRDGLVTFFATASPGRYPESGQVAELFRRATDEIAAIPGVSEAATASAGPLFGGRETDRFRIEGRPAPPPDELPAVRWFDIGPSYFHTLGLRILRGRDITAADREGAPPVALINRTMAERYWPGADPIGQRVAMVESGAVLEIVGVVADARPFFHGPPEPEIYWSNLQFPRWGTMFLVRTAGDPGLIARAVSARLARMDPDLQLSSPRTMDELIERRLVAPRFDMLLVVIFAAAATLLAAAGLYGVLAWTVALRRKEIGIRMALGAARAGVTRDILAEGLLLAAAGVAAGIAGALGLSRFLGSLIFGIGPTDPFAYFGAALLLLAVAALACWLPARRASRVDPMGILRQE